MKKFFRRLVAACVASLCTCAVVPATALAQEAEEGERDSVKYELEESVVIGTRSAERIIDIPYSVFRVDKKELSFGRKISARDVLADVPGLFLQSRYGNRDLRISIRGFGTKSNSGARAVRILQDGIPESDPDGETVLDAIDFTSLGGVEVVKGNLSSLYANAPGGVINFSSDLYFLDSYAGLTGQYGAHGLAQTGVRLGLENLLNRLYLSYNYSQILGFRPHSEEYLNLVSLASEAYLADQTTISAFGNYVSSLNKLPGPLTSAEYNVDPFQAVPVAIAQDTRRMTHKGRFGLRYKTTFGGERPDEVELTLYGASKNLERADNAVYSVATRTSLGALGRYTHRSRLFGRPNTVTTGVDYAYQAGPVTEFDNIAGNRGPSVESEFTESLSNLGVYLLDKVTLVDDRLELVVSARFDWNAYRRDIFVPFGFIDTAKTFGNFTPKLGLTYKLLPWLALYTSAGVSHDMPALSETRNTPISSDIRYSMNPDLEPQRSTHLELGIKGNAVNPESEFLRKLYFDLTFFRITVQDEIVPFTINQTTFFRNAGRAERTGLEMGCKSEPVERVEVVVNYTYTHFRYDEYVTTEYTSSGSTTVDYSGKTIPAIPQHLFNFILNYELELSEEFSGLLQWDCDYISSMYVNDGNTEEASPYFYGNIMGGIGLREDALSVTVYAGVHNLFDRRYVGFINVNDATGRYYETAEPRSTYAGVKVNYRL